MKPAIRVDHLSKQYRLGSGLPGWYRTLRETIMDVVAAPWLRLREFSPWRAVQGKGRQGDPQTDTFWALKDVSLEVRRGEAVAIIGRNGAGKSTLLKILSRITEPTAGRVELRGRAGSLLEVGTGFHPELTGRENISLYGAILGMSRREITSKFDEIVAFAEIDQFLETPVKRYSSGMYVRLAFAVAAHLEPEILIVDEVLAVGDANFQKKCLKKMSTIAGEGRTVLFVSHNMGAVQALCPSALMLVHGEIARTGPVREVVAEYLKHCSVLSSVPISERADRSGTGRFKFEDLTVLDARRNRRDFAVTGEDMYFRLRVSAPGPNTNMPGWLDVAIILRDFQGHRITTLASQFTGESPTPAGGALDVTCFLPRLPLAAGEYRLDLWCETPSGCEDALTDAALLRVEGGNYFETSKDARLPVADRHGCCLIPQRWSSANGRNQP